MSGKKKTTEKAIADEKMKNHMESLRNTKYEISALTLAQLSELLQHLASIPYNDIIGMIGAEIHPQLPEEAQKELAELELVEPTDIGEELSKESAIFEDSDKSIKSEEVKLKVVK